MSTEILAAILATLKRIESRLSAPAPGLPRALSASDRETLAQLLPAIRTAIGGAVFTAKDLQLVARQRDPVLKAKVEACLGTDASLKTLGKLLTRAAGASVASVTVVRIGKVRDGVLWRIDG